MIPQAHGMLQHNAYEDLMYNLVSDDSTQPLDPAQKDYQTGRGSTYKSASEIYAQTTQLSLRKKSGNCIYDGGMRRSQRCVNNYRQLAWTV